MHPLRNLWAAKKERNGFTLIEMAVVIMVVGLLISAFAPIYTLHLKKKAMDDTNLDIATISTAIGNFRTLHGRYPCPASLTAQRGDVNYGHETDCEDISVAPGSPLTNGVIIQQNIRTIPPSVTPETLRVRVGAVPFRELNLQEDQSIDGYNNRITYVVTEGLAISNTFKADHGGIDILNDQSQSAITPQASAHFLVLSYGENSAGAFTRSGVQLACPASGLENTNCAGGANATYRTSQGDSSATDSHFDDALVYFTRDEIPLWELSGQPGHERDIHQKPSGDVGVGTSATTTLNQTSDVNGIIRVQDDPTTTAVEGDTLVDNICSFDQTDCFPSSLIAGEIATGGGMKCPEDDPDATGTYMVGVANGAPICEDEVFITCNPGEFISGVNADGTLVCAGPPPLGCPDQDIAPCAPPATPVTLTAGPHGTIHNIDAGANYHATFECRNGIWTRTAFSGSCTCTPTVLGGSRACASGFSGTIFTQNTLTCPAGTWSGYVDVSDTCVCDVRTDTRSIACPAGFNRGNITQQNDHTCTPPAWSGWHEIGRTCECVPQTTSRTAFCTGGLTGSWTQTVSYLCPGGPTSPGNWDPAGWSPASPPAGACTCVPRTVTSHGACPPGYIGGGIDYENRFECPAATWTGNVAVTTDCNPAPPAVCSWQSTGSGVTGTSGIGKRVGSTCACDGSSTTGPCTTKLGDSNYINYATCVCQ